MRSLGKSLALAAGVATLLASALPAYAAVWVPGHWQGGRFIAGHYAAGPGAVIVRPAPRVVVRPAPRVAVVAPTPRVVVPVR